MLHVDHVVPRSAGGTDTPSNLVVACAACNVGRNTDGLRPHEQEGKKRTTLLLDAVLAFFEDHGQPTTATDISAAIHRDRTNISSLLFNNSEIFTSHRDRHKVLYYPR
jgi:hypothetical protein